MCIRDRVAGVDARLLDVLHDTGNEDILAITDGVHLQFAAHNITIDQHRAVPVSYTHLDVYKRQR